MLWLKQNLWWLSTLSIVLFIGGSFVLAIFLVQMPADRFIKPPAFASVRHPVLRWMLKAMKNIAGVLLICLGIVMALPLVPGPGLLLIVIGVGLTEFPGKRAIEIRLIQKRLALQPINWLRGKFHRPPLQAPASDR